MALYEMRKFVAPEFIFGVNARHRVGFYARNMMARRVFVVTDPGVIAAGWVVKCFIRARNFVPIMAR
jgi:alcohol dehydrogenase class IV